jgi:hypothetical protein
MSTGITTVIYLPSRTHLFEPFEVGEAGSDGCDFRDPPGILPRHVQPGFLLVPIQSTAPDKVHIAWKKTWKRKVIA